MFYFVHKNTSELIKIKPGPFITKEKQGASVDKKTWSKIKKRKRPSPDFCVEFTN